jgi:Aspartyl protease
MPSLTFPLVPSGLAVPVWIGLDGNDTAKLHTAGRPIPPPAAARGEIDTGCSVTAVAPWVFRQLALTPAGSQQSQTASGPVQVQLYHVSLSITDPANPGGPMLAHPTLLVSELAVTLPDADVLIGMDVLRECQLLLDGPAGRYTLIF